MPVLDLVNINKSFGNIEVLKDICVSIEKGGFLVLLGPSGCGKSTLLNCIAGLEEVSGGKVIINNREMNSVPPKDRDIAMVFQSYALYPNMTVAENIGFGMKVRGLPKTERSAKIAEVAATLQITELLDRKPAALSGGQRQRVAIGRALVRAPKLFLFDEPLSNLDARLRGEMREEIKLLHQQVQASIVYVTHDQIEAMTLATKIVVLKDGAIQQIGCPGEIYDTPANVFVAEFMGAPPMNIFSIDVNNTELQVIAADGRVMKAVIPKHSFPNGRFLAGYRPEHFLDSSSENADFSLSLTVGSVERTGADVFATFPLSDSQKIIARFPPKWNITPNDTIDLHFSLADITVFDPDSKKAVRKTTIR